MHKAFTMIELIFVIVIIGILAAVAIPKLSATRDDAESSALAANIRMCIADAAAEFTSQGILDDLIGLATCDSAISKEVNSVILSGNNVRVTSTDTAVNAIIPNGDYPVKGTQVSR